MKKSFPIKLKNENLLRFAQVIILLPNTKWDAPNNNWVLQFLQTSDTFDEQIMIFRIKQLVVKKI